MRSFQAADKKSWRIPFSNVYTQTKHSMKYYHHWGTTLFMIWIHGMCLLGPATYSPVLAMVTVPIIILFGLGIEMVFHRMLCHKAFSSPKWWEYTMAYFGILNIQVRYLLRNLIGHDSCCLFTVPQRKPLPCLAVQHTFISCLFTLHHLLLVRLHHIVPLLTQWFCFQGDPIEWVSDHRYHHQHTDTPLDPHSPYDGYFWAHIGWLWDNEVCTLSIMSFTYITFYCALCIAQPPALLFNSLSSPSRQ